MPVYRQYTVCIVYVVSMSYIVHDFTCSVTEFMRVVIDFSCNVANVMCSLICFVYALRLSFNSVWPVVRILALSGAWSRCHLVGGCSCVTMGTFDVVFKAWATAKFSQKAKNITHSICNNKFIKHTPGERGAVECSGSSPDCPCRVEVLTLGWPSKSCFSHITSLVLVHAGGAEYSWVHIHILVATNQNYFRCTQSCIFMSKLIFLQWPQLPGRGLRLLSSSWWNGCSGPISLRFSNLCAARGPFFLTKNSSALFGK